MERQKKPKRQPILRKRSTVHLWLSPELAAAVEKVRQEENRTRANLLIQLIQEALRARGEKI
jgi:hypothetical protein